jgi:two-component system OmpR family sensor kinase
VDGGKRKLTGSLQFRLSATLSALIALLAIGAGVFSYVSAFDEAIEWQDANLRQMSAMTDGRSAKVDLPVTIIDTVPDPDLEVVVEVLGPSNVAHLGGPFKFTQPIRDGMQTVHVDGEAWRLYARRLESGNLLVVAQRSAEREEVARESALQATVPLAALVPVLIALVSVVVRRTLRPMTALARDLDQRTEHDLAALQADPVPNELRPFIASINKLFARLDAALAGQRRFVAVAAHELRSPLTALTLQAEQLSARIHTAEEKEFMARLQSGLQRMRGLLDQLLTLARAEAGAVERSTGASSVSAIVRSLIEEHLPLAEARKIDLGVVGEMADARVAGKAVDIHAMLRNLLDNAIRYTPVGGRVDISVRRDGDRVRIDVVDDGPGLSAEEMQHVFDPFYRVLGSDAEGSGLGLAIVRVIVGRLGGTVTLANEATQGLRVQVDLPAADGTPAEARLADAADTPVGALRPAGE